MWGDVFTKNLSLLFDVSMLLLLHRQSEYSGLRPDTSSLVVPSFDTKVMEYLCSGWVFFSSDKFRLFIAIFDRIFFYLSKVLLH